MVRFRTQQRLGIRARSWLSTMPPRGQSGRTIDIFFGYFKTRPRIVDERHAQGTWRQEPGKKRKRKRTSDHNVHFWCKPHHPLKNHTIHSFQDRRNATLVSSQKVIDETRRSSLAEIQGNDACAAPRGTPVVG